MAPVKAYELRKESKENIEKKLDEFRAELSSLRVAQVSNGNASKLGKIHEVRKNIARALTVLNQIKRAEARKSVEGKKYLPTDMRVKKTRAMRRALTPEQATKLTLSQKKKLAAFPPRKFALRA